MKLANQEAPSQSSWQPPPKKIRKFAAKFPRHLLRTILPVAAAGLFFITPAQAALIYSGDIVPATDPSTWINGVSGTQAYIGDTGYGSLTVNGGSSLTAFRSYIGNKAGSGGNVTVDGPGSMWTGNSLIYAGYDGNGVMNITNGGAVDARATYFGYNSGSMGNVSVNGSGSALNILYNIEVGYNGNGTLNITNGGNVTASGLRLGYSAGSTGTVNINGAGSKLAIIYNPSNNPLTNIGYYGNGLISIQNGGTMENAGSFQIGLNTGTYGTVSVDGIGSSWNCNAVDGGLNIGQTGNGTLSITNGGTVTTNATYGVTIADNFTTGTVNVSGPGSTWSITTSDIIYVSRMGNGKLNITNGGKVISNGGTIIVGRTSNSGGSGTITVNGAGSSFSHQGVVNLGPPPGSANAGIGRLIISDGGTASASSLNISSSSLLSADVGHGSSLTIGGGSGTITNNGNIRLVAGASAANGTYRPLSYGTMTGSGFVQALGGVWDLTNRTVTVSSAATGAAGEANTVNLANTQRFLITDGASGKSAGAAFQATASPVNLTLTASVISGSELTSLQSLLGSGEAILSSWDFTTEGYTTGNPVYLSLFAGAGQSLSHLNIWHFDGSAWGRYDASDLAYDNNFASFTATNLSGYAVSGAAPVPIPPAVFLFGSGLSGLFFFRRKKMPLD